MFDPIGLTYSDFAESWRKSDRYALADTRLVVRDAATATFTAATNRPDDVPVWVRCWVSNAVEGSLAEAEVETDATNVSLPKGETYFLDELRLNLETIESSRQMIESMPLDVRAELSSDSLKLATNAIEATAWIHGFAVFDRHSGERVGSGGFIAPPRDGQVWRWRKERSTCR